MWRTYSLQHLCKHPGIVHTSVNAARTSGCATPNMPAHRSLRDFDWLMLILVSAICALGVLQIYSATRDTHFTEAWWKQGIWILAGFAALWIGTLIDYHTLLGQVAVLYVLAVMTLIATFAVGTTIFGSRRWIGSPSYHIQPSEFVKLVIVLLVARSAQAGRPGWLADDPGDVAAGSRYGLDVCSDPRRRSVFGGVSLAVCGGDPGADRRDSADRLLAGVEGLS